MRTIIRCPSCFTYVYADARTCHGCGERIGHRKILRRGSWIFIALVVTGFAIGRAIDLENDAQRRAYAEESREERAVATREFVKAWLLGDSDKIGTLLSDREPLESDLAKLRDLYPTVLPASVALANHVRITDESRQTHTQLERGNGGISHANWSQNDPTARRRASCVPERGPSGTFRWMVDGVKKQGRSWNTDTAEFEAEFSKDGAHYTLHGELCLDGGKVCCLTIDHIQGIEGPVKPKE